MKIQSGPMTRKPSNERQYIEHRAKKANSQTNTCVFCDIVSDHANQVIDETKHCLVIKNLFSYDIWDGCGVEEQFMIIPKRHVASLGELSPEEKIDYMGLEAKYEENGYSLYARSPGNKTKSVTHQHMHLMKIDNVRKKWAIYLRRPHVLWMK